MNTVEELMKPRVKHIAPYPTSKMYFNVGDILVFNGTHYVLNGAGCSNVQMAKETIDEYPHLFKPLAWWQDRSESEMPEYVKHTDGGVLRCEWVKGINGLKAKAFGYSTSEYDVIPQQYFGEFTPATETEYLAYINNK